MTTTTDYSLLPLSFPAVFNDILNHLDVQDWNSCEEVCSTWKTFILEHFYTSQIKVAAGSQCRRILLIISWFQMELYQADISIMNGSTCFFIQLFIPSYFFTFTIMVSIFGGIHRALKTSKNTQWKHLIFVMSGLHSGVLCKSLGQALFFTQGKDKRIKLLTNTWGRASSRIPETNIDFGSLTPSNLDLTPCGKYIFIAFYPRESGRYCFLNRLNLSFYPSDVRCLELKDGCIRQVKALNSNIILAMKVDNHFHQWVLYLKSAWVGNVWNSAFFFGITWMYCMYFKRLAISTSTRSRGKGHFLGFGGFLGSASSAEFPVSLSNHVGFMPRLLYSSTHRSPESFAHLKTGWVQGTWLQWSYENWYFHLDISRWPRGKGHNKGY